MMLSSWVQFSWKLDLLPETAPVPSTRYALEPARIPDDIQLLEAAISRSYSMEAAWAHDLTPRVQLTHELLHHPHPADYVFLAVKHGTRIIGAAPICLNTEASVQLPVGICVLNEYRCRGIGTLLLYEALSLLWEKGRETATVVTKKGVTADRFLYTKFGSTRTLLASSQKPTVALPTAVTPARPGTPATPKP